VSMPINLNRFRKKKQRADKEQQAQENRVSFGRTKAEKKNHDTETTHTKQKLDGHKLGEEKPSP